MPCRFYLGTHKPLWLLRVDVPLFVSARRLREVAKPRPALGPWALDSGAFTELKDHGKWTIRPWQYVNEVRRWRDTIGGMEWAAPQDWMCEPIVIKGGTLGKDVFKGTGLSVRKHQDLTVNNYLSLTALAPDIPWVPVLQGWEFDDYLRHLEDYRAAGVDLGGRPLVGLGSVCRRQDTGMAEELIRHLHGLGLRIHGFGFKLLGLARAACWLASSDSMAWSLSARREDPLPGCEHSSCANCLRYALAWREKALGVIAAAERCPAQARLF